MLTGSRALRSGACRLLALASLARAGQWQCGVGGPCRFFADAPPAAPDLPGWAELPLERGVSLHAAPLTASGALRRDLGCSDGGVDYYFLAHRANSTKLHVDFSGGGACYDYLTCVARPFCRTSAEMRQLLEMSNASAGAFPPIYDDALAENPFAGWNRVILPYCSCDLHMGDDEGVVYMDAASGLNASVSHLGSRNVRWVLEWLFREFSHLDTVVVGGCSAGGVGALAWAGEIFSRFPAARLALASDSAWVPALPLWSPPWRVAAPDGLGVLALEARALRLAGRFAGARLVLSSYSEEELWEMLSYDLGDCSADLGFEDRLRASLATTKAALGDRLATHLLPGVGHCVSHEEASRPHSRQFLPWLADALVRPVADVSANATPLADRGGNENVEALRRMGRPPHCPAQGAAGLQANASFVQHGERLVSEVYAEVEALLQASPGSECAADVVRLWQSPRTAALLLRLRPWMALNLKCMILLHPLMKDTGCRPLSTLMRVFRVHRALNWGNAARSEGHLEQEVERLYWLHWESLKVWDGARAVERVADRSRYCAHIEAEWRTLKQEARAWWGGEWRKPPGFELEGAMEQLCTSQAGNGLLAYTVINDWEWHLRDAKAALLRRDGLGKATLAHIVWHWLAIIVMLMPDSGADVYDVMFVSFEVLIAVPAGAAAPAAGPRLPALSAGVAALLCATAALFLASAAYWFPCRRGSQRLDRLRALLLEAPEVLQHEDASLSVDSLCLSYGSYSIESSERVRLECTPGSLTYLIGDSGVGKTTLLEWLAGYRESFVSTRGRVVINGEECRRPADRARWISLCRQSDGHGQVLDKLPVLEVLWCSLRCDHAAASEAALLRLLASAWQLVGLPERLLSLPYERLSGGQKSMVQLARRMASLQPIMIFDEPTSGLDMCSALKLVRCIKKVVSVARVVALVAIHQPSPLMCSFCDQVAVLLPRGSEAAEELQGMLAHGAPEPGAGEAAGEDDGEDEAAAEEKPVPGSVLAYCGPRADATAIPARAKAGKLKVLLGALLPSPGHGPRAAEPAGVARTTSRSTAARTTSASGAARPSRGTVLTIRSGRSSTAARATVASGLSGGVEPVVLEPGALDAPPGRCGFLRHAHALLLWQSTWCAANPQHTWCTVPCVAALALGLLMRGPGSPLAAGLMGSLSLFLPVTLSLDPETNQAILFSGIFDDALRRDARTGVSVQAASRTLQLLVPPLARMGLTALLLQFAVTGLVFARAPAPAELGIALLTSLHLTSINVLLWTKFRSSDSTRYAGHMSVVTVLAFTSSFFLPGIVFPWKVLADSWVRATRFAYPTWWLVHCYLMHTLSAVPWACGGDGQAACLAPSGESYLRQLMFDDPEACEVAVPLAFGVSVSVLLLAFAVFCARIAHSLRAAERASRAGRALAPPPSDLAGPALVVRAEAVGGDAGECETFTV